MATRDRSGPRRGFVLDPTDTKLERIGTGDSAAQYIRRLIFNGELRPGQHVPQDDIAERLGISRIPVREALIALEREGWVTIERHRGAFINQLDQSTVRDHYDLYGLIYGFAAQKALVRSRADELVNSLSQISKDLQNTESHEETGELTVHFHRTVVRCSMSRRIEVSLLSLSALVPGSFFAMVPDAAGTSRRHLPAIARAVKAKDSERIAKEYATLMRRVGEEVVDLFTSQGLFDSANTALDAG